jgi:uncharacterized protein YabE (DUF348 family)
MNINLKQHFKKLSFACIMAGFFWAANVYAEEQNFVSPEKNIAISDNGLVFSVQTSAETVGQMLTEQKIKIGEHDAVYPSQNEKLFASTNVIIQRAKKITIIDGSEKIATYTFERVVENAVWENPSLNLGEDDFTVPSRSSLIKDGMEIKITHVLIKEETKDEPIDFKTVTNEDDKLSWREKKVTQKGEKGIKQVKYKVVYYNGQEISRKVLEKNVTKDPVEEIVTQGTFVKVGKTHTGVASWYAYTGTMAAANPWLPMGSYVRVINQDNGKSVIVKINDRGPFGNGRIIDLDKAAFAKIASLGAGVANIKMEVITN